MRSSFTACNNSTNQELRLSDRGREERREGWREIRREGGKREEGKGRKG